MSRALVLHWWNDDINVRPYQDASNPVVLAAATIRRNNWDLPIYVVDVSSCRRPASHWLHFPYKFGFKVIKRDSFLGELVPHFGKIFNFRLLSRVWDIEMAMRDVAEDNIIFMDSDIFCLGPVDPVPGVYSPEFFHANHNNGVWFYNKESRSSKVVFDHWKGMICRAIHDDDFRHELYHINPAYGTYFMQDEFVYRALSKFEPNHVRPVDMKQNYLFHWLYSDPPSVTREVRGLHCLSFVTGTNRHKLFFNFKELREQIPFDEQDYRLVFGLIPPDPKLSLRDIYKNPDALEDIYQVLGIKGKESFIFDGLIQGAREGSDARHTVGSLRLPLL